ncbi:MAG: lysozyme inhibitor LprI family protein [Gammaproteobacteria bacterium]|nr:lysozyme inhibitor LprI family protein [Gammaproteobacteria bacterium]
MNVNNPKTHQLFTVLFALLVFVTSLPAFAIDSESEQKWIGKWNDNPAIPENPTIYYYYELTLAEDGFNWRSVYRDVPYGPNEEIQTGFADFYNEHQAGDNSNKRKFVLGEDKQGRTTLTVSAFSQSNGGEVFYLEPKYFKAGFDCKKASSTIEKGICTNKRIAMADLEMNQQYKDARKKLSSDALKDIKAAQRSWAKNRKACAKGSKLDKPCLALAYAHRLATLQKINNPELGKGEGVDSDYLTGLAKTKADLSKNVPMLLLVAAKDEDWAKEMMKHHINFSVDKVGNNTTLIGKYSYPSICWPADCTIHVTLSVSTLKNGTIEVTRLQTSN